MRRLTIVMMDESRRSITRRLHRGYNTDAFVNPLHHRGRYGSPSFLTALRLHFSVCNLRLNRKVRRSIVSGIVVLMVNLFTSQFRLTMFLNHQTTSLVPSGPTFDLLGFSVVLSVLFGVVSLSGHYRLPSTPLYFSKVRRPPRPRSPIRTGMSSLMPNVGITGTSAPTISTIQWIIGAMM